MTQLTGFTQHSQEGNSGLLSQSNIQHAFQFTNSRAAIKRNQDSENAIFSYELERLSQGWIEKGSL